MTFHAKPAVRYFARPALLAIILPLLCISGLYDIIFLHNTAVSIFCGFDVVQNVYFLAVIIGINIISIFIYTVYWKELHEKCFAKIKICKYEIIWKCVLRKKRVIKIDNCRFIGVESEKSFNGPDYPFIYFSSSPYPTEFSHKINKINNSDKFIKFWYTDRLADYLLAHLSKEKTGGLQYYCNRKKVERRYSKQRSH